MPHEVIMPALGMAQDTGLLIAWLKAPGEAVAIGDVLFEVETDKSTMEVEAQVAGFLTGVSVSAGTDVPVGQVIAMISETPEEVSAAPAPQKPETAAPVSALPDGQIVIMPALGMAQDTGLIVAWRKAPGDTVAANDILFEVETDKSTLEVEAGFDGFVAALLAAAGEDAPVGDAIAIISTQRPASPVQRSRATGTPAASAPVAKAAPAQPAAASARPAATLAPKAGAVAAPSADGRILASPKLRRLAMEQGLDLSQLVAAGHPQPYHVSDLEALKALPAKAPVSATVSMSRHLVAQISGDGFAAFARWAADTAGLKDGGALLAGLAAGSRGKALVVAVECFGQTQTYAARQNLRATAVCEDAPELLLRDLRGSHIASVRMGVEHTPVLTIACSQDGLTLTLECAEHQLGASEAITLLSNFAGRMEQPLRHLL